jgi:phosphoribosylformylglycinamidine synthase
MSKPRALVVAAPGTNRDADVSFALELAGADPIRVTPKDLEEDSALLRQSHLLVLAGGFSYGDNTGAGRLFALDVETHAGSELRDFVDHGKPVIGICNGFQALVRAGLLPGGTSPAALGHNSNGVFDCRWVEIKPVSKKCIWTRELVENIKCPIAHGEGRFTCSDSTLRQLSNDDSIALVYAGTNPNGSTGDIAGICDPSGVVLGLMPHPENHVLARQNPRSVRGDHSGLGLHLFRSGVQYAVGR